MVGHSNPPPPTPMSRCLIWDLAAELGRETAVALRSHKQDVRDKLSQHTHRARGARWVRAMSMNAINNANRRCTYFISSGYLVSERPARCVTSERQQRRTTLWYRVDQVNIQMNCEQRWSVLINTESLGVPSITPAFISAASVDMLTGTLNLHVVRLWWMQRWEFVPLSDCKLSSQLSLRLKCDAIV